MTENEMALMLASVAVGNPLCPIGQEEMVNKVANGTPIPKGHGRLIDADKLQYEINNDKREAFSKHQVWLLLSIYNENVPTIMEADNTESEDKE